MTTDARDLSREISIKGKRYVYERHASGAYHIDLLMMGDDSSTLAACGALVLALPLFAKKASFRRSVPKAAEKLFGYLTEHPKGPQWSVAEVLEAGNHAFTWCAAQVPVTSGSDEVEEAKDFSEAGQDDTPGE